MPRNVIDLMRDSSTWNRQSDGTGHFGHAKPKNRFLSPISRPAAEERTITRVNRDQREKDLLSLRKECFQRHDRDAIDRPMSMVPEANAMFSNSTERFSRQDPVLEERATRLARQHQRLERKREVVAERDDQRWSKMENEHTKSESRIAMERRTNSRAMKNTTGLPIDLFTLRYQKNIAGENLRQQDAVIIDRAMRRSEALFNKRNSSVNPITGEPQGFPKCSDSARMWN